MTNKNNNLKFNESNDLQIPKVVSDYLQSIDFPVDFLDVALIMKMGAEKHGKDTWLDKDNPSLQKKANFASTTRHLAKRFCNLLEDDESGLDHYLHVATRSLMAYARTKKGIDKAPDNCYINNK